MYFWRINKLKQQLAERPLTAREELPYLVLYVALTTAVPFATAALVVPLTEEYIPVAVDAAVTVGIAVFGTIYIYQQNGGLMGSHFLQRYFAVGWVVGLRVMAFALPLMLAAYAVADYTAGYDSSIHTSWLETAAFWILQAFMFYRSGYHVHDVATRNRPAQSPGTDNA